MGLRSLIQVGAILAVLAVSSGQLPQFLHKVRLARLYVVKKSMSSEWGQAMLLPLDLTYGRK